MFITKIRNETILNPQRLTGLPSCLPPNQSLKLTEPAVDDFAARNNQLLVGHDLRSRGLDYVAAALRRRSLAPVR